MIRITIDGKHLELEKPINLLEAAKLVGINIPNLCYSPELTPYGGCRLCLVEIEGRKTPVASCSRLAEDGMVVRTNTPQIREIRRELLNLRSATIRWTA